LELWANVPRVVVFLEERRAEEEERKKERKKSSVKQMEHAIPAEKREHWSYEYVRCREKQGGIA